MTLENLQKQLATFRDERNWSQFHNPKNLAMALSVEVAELCEHFQWLTAEQSASLTHEQQQDVAFEMADVLNYLLLLADQLDVDILATAQAKIKLNEQRYPAEQAHGSAAKYTAYQDNNKD